MKPLQCLISLRRIPLFRRLVLRLPELLRESVSRRGSVIETDRRWKPVINDTQDHHREVTQGEMDSEMQAWWSESSKPAVSEHLTITAGLDGLTDCDCRHATTRRRSTNGSRLTCDCLY